MVRLKQKRNCFAYLLKSAFAVSLENTLAAVLSACIVSAIRKGDSSLSDLLLSAICMLGILFFFSEVYLLFSMFADIDYAVLFTSFMVILLSAAGIGSIFLRLTGITRYMPLACMPQESASLISAGRIIITAFWVFLLLAADTILWRLKND